MTGDAPDFFPAWENAKTGKSGPAFPSGHPALGPLWTYVWDLLATLREPISLSDLYTDIRAHGYVFSCNTVRSLLGQAAYDGHLTETKIEGRRYYVRPEAAP